VKVPPSPLHRLTVVALAILALLTGTARAAGDRYLGAATAETSDRLGLLIGEWLREPSPGRRWVRCIIETPNGRRIQLQRFENTFVLAIPTLERVASLDASDGHFVSNLTMREPDLPVLYRLPDSSVARVEAWLKARQITPTLVRNVRRRADGTPDAFRAALLWVGGSAALMHDFDFARLLSEALEEPPPYTFRAEKRPPTIDAVAGREPLSPLEAISLAASGPTEGVFRFTVAGQGQDARKIYLNSEPDYRLPTCLTIAVDRRIENALLRLAGYGTGDLVGKTIRVAGTVSRVRIHYLDEKRQPTGRFYYQTHVAVVSADQLTVEKD
jgi:hypothetical protein